MYRAYNFNDRSDLWTGLSNRYWSRDVEWNDARHWSVFARDRVFLGQGMHAFILFFSLSFPSLFLLSFFFSLRRTFNSRRWASPRASIDGIFILFEFEFGLMIRRAVRIIRGEYLVSLIVVTERDDMVDGAKSLETRLKYCRISLKTAASTRRRIMTLFPAVNSCQRRRAFRQ